MAHALSVDLEKLVKEKVEVELRNISLSKEGTETRSHNKTAKDVASVLIPDIACIITAAVCAAVNNAVSEITSTIQKQYTEVQKIGLVNKYDSDTLEQYTRRDNIRITGVEEEGDETEEVLEAKIIELANDMGVVLKTDDISIAHRLGKPQGKNRPVIVRLCHRKKRNEMLRKKKELKSKQKKVFVNEDLTFLRATLFKIAREQENVKNATTKDGRILAWLNGKDRPEVITTPEDLFKLGIHSVDWKRLKLDHIVQYSV